MTATAWEVAATTTVEDNTSGTLARRLRAHLQALAALRLPITYQEAAKALLLSPPNIIHQVTEALAQIMALMRGCGLGGGGLAARLLSLHAVPRHELARV